MTSRWSAAIEEAVTGPPHWRGLTASGLYLDCDDLVPSLSLFPSEWAALAEGLTTPGIPEDRLFFLGTLDVPTADALLLWGPVLRSAYSVRARAIAAKPVRRYARRAAQSGSADVPAWRALVLDVLRKSEVSEVLIDLIPATIDLAAPTAAENAGALDALAAILRSPVTRTAHAEALCAAYALTAGDAEALAAFLAEIDPAALSAKAQHLLATPSDCSY